MPLTDRDFDTWKAQRTALVERGLLKDDVVTCDEGATPVRHKHTKRWCVRVMIADIVERSGPRFFVHGFNRGIVAYVPSSASIPEGTKCVVTDMRESSCTLEVRLPEKDVLSVLPDDFDKTNYCSSEYYKFEERAIEHLESKGWTIKNTFQTMEGDSFGPLFRILYNAITPQGHYINLTEG